MTDVSQLDTIHRMLKFSFTLSFLGKIWVLWFDEFTINSREVGDQLVHMRVQAFNSYEFSFLVVYAKCTRVGRRGLWEALKEVKVLGSPWIVVGDFNVMFLNWIPYIVC